VEDEPLPLSDPAPPTTPIAEAEDVPTLVGDEEKGVAKVEKELDVEHLEVNDDPREWSRLKKNAILA
jgi:hypothetical protein